MNIKELEEIKKRNQDLQKNAVTNGGSFTLQDAVNISRLIAFVENEINLGGTHLKPPQDHET